jgi:hypothetical protein
MSESTRAYIYRVVIAALPLLTLWGVIQEKDAPLYVGLAAAILSVGLAVKNTSTDR